MSVVDKIKRKEGGNGHSEYGDDGPLLNFNNAPANCKLGYRYMHTLTGFYHPGLEENQKNSRDIWIKFPTPQSTPFSKNKVKNNPYY